MHKISEMQGQSSVKEKVEHLTQALYYEGHKNLSRSYYLYAEGSCHDVKTNCMHTFLFHEVSFHSFTTYPFLFVKTMQIKIFFEGKASISILI